MKFLKRIFAASALAALAITNIPVPSHAAESNMKMGSQMNSKFKKEMHSNMMKMDKDMKAAHMNGDADHDFVTMMMPHHQGAIEMAKTYLKYGSDPKIKEMAQKIVDDQNKEIQDMQKWLDERK